MPSTRRDVNPCSVGQHSYRCAATTAPLSDQNPQIGRAATFGELLSFRLSVSPAHDEAVGVVVMLQQLPAFSTTVKTTNSEHFVQSISLIYPLLNFHYGSVVEAVPGEPTNLICRDGAGRADKTNL